MNVNTLDQFFTTPEVAKECIQLIDNLDKYETIIEPSAGNGSFSKLIPNCTAYDIMPMDNSIIKQDWLLYNNYHKENLLIIGNPPFGTRSRLAKAFIRKSIEIGANCIAFILPDTFNKLTMQNVFPDNWKLIVKHKISNENFILPNGTNYFVPCSFYIWTNDNTQINLREKKYTCPTEFSFLKRGDLTADFTINGNNGRIKDISQVTNPKAEHYIRANSPNIRDELSKVNFNFNSSVNGGNAWIGQQDIIKAYLEYKNNS